MEIVHHMQSTRYIKTHLPFNLLPQQIQNSEKTPKIIYVARNPKDVCVSYYHHKVLTEAYDKTVDEFVDEFVDDVSESNYAPYWSHVKQFWERRHQSNILFITFEDMKKVCTNKFPFPCSCFMNDMCLFQPKLVLISFELWL